MFRTYPRFCVRKIQCSEKFPGLVLKLFFLGLFLSSIVPSESLLFFCSCLSDSALVLLSLVSESSS